MAFVSTAKLQQSRPIVDGQGRPTAEFLRIINDNTNNLAQAINAIAALPEIQDALVSLDAATQAANEAAANAQTATDANKREAALQGSYIDPSAVLSATTTTITIAAHTRKYADGTSKTVNGGTIAATAAGDVDYVFYLDANRQGGAVTYQVSTTQPIQMGARHVVGAVEIPATGTADGGEGPTPPGRVYPYKLADSQ